jgi:hypothetical protein
MSMMKRYLENISVEMGFGGAITDEVLAVSTNRFSHAEDDIEVYECIGCGDEFCAPANMKHDLCKNCATIACEEGFTSYADFLVEPPVPFYVAVMGEAVPTPTEPPPDKE